MTVDVLLSRLDSVQGRGPTWRTICPAHESRHRTRSLAIREEEDGRILIHCHAGCGVEQVIAAIGLHLSDLMPKRPATIRDDQKPRNRKPWRSSEVVAALKGELHVALIILADVHAGNSISDGDRERAGVALECIAHFIAELEIAH